MNKLVMTPELQMLADLKVVHQSHMRFGNAKGGPYRYGFPLKFTRDVAEAIRHDLLK